MGMIPFNGNLDRREEERRLLYVAITRSRKDLYLYWTPPISPFLKDAEVEKNVQAVAKLEKVLASEPEEWQKQEIPVVAKGLARFGFERFFSEWCSKSQEFKQQVAKRVIDFYEKRQEEADKEKDNESMTPEETSFWHAFFWF